MASQGPPQGPPGNPFNFRPGQQPTPEQIAAMQRQLAIDAQKNGMTVPEFVAKLKQQQLAMQQAAQQGGQPQPRGQPQQGAPQPITPGPPKPEALAVAKFLKSQDLKPRTCILNGQRKDMFKGKNSSKSEYSKILTVSQ
jgi:translocation protein SEC62